MIRILAGAALALFSCLPVQAQGVCMDRTALAKWLYDKYQEQPRWVGIVNAGTLMETYVSPAGTWTMVMSTANGLSCIIGAGDSYEAVASKEPGKPI